MTFSLYVHIPFCRKICPYCDFTKYAQKNFPEEKYLLGLIDELQIYRDLGDFNSSKIETIFFGGGTPSVFSPESIKRVIDCAKELFGFCREDIEITLEANPNDIHSDFAQEIKATGVNRVSLGAQSFSERVLQFLGRDHRAKDIYNAVQCLRDVGLSNINLDLIYGVPDQTLSELETDLTTYLSLKPEHISTYNLTIEKGTPFFQAVESGVFQKLDDEVERELYLAIMSTLKREDYHHYEVSNFSKYSYECQHNINYWNRSSYLGIGVGAHSFFTVSSGEEKRFSNTASLSEYVKKLEEKKTPIAWSETLSAYEKRTEDIMLSLRREDGLDIQRAEYKPLLLPLESYVKSGDGVISGERFRLTEQGILCADVIAGDLVSYLQTE